MHWDGGYYGWGWGMGLLMVLFWVLVIVGIVYLIRSFIGAERKGMKEESALDILKKRYARGEISKEEFEEKKKDIR